MKHNCSPFFSGVLLNAIWCTLVGSASSVLQPSKLSRFHVIHEWKEAGQTYATPTDGGDFPALHTCDVMLQTLGILKVQPTQLYAYKFIHSRRGPFANLNIFYFPSSNSITVCACLYCSGSVWKLIFDIQCLFQRIWLSFYLHILWQRC